MASQFEFLEMLDLTIENKIRDFLNTAFPAKITGIAQFENNQFVDVQPLVSIRYGDGANEADLITPVIYSVPVVFPSGGGGMLSFPLKVGENVLVVISQRDIGDWLESNGDYVGVKNTQRFDLTDAIAIPSIFTSSGNLSPNPDDVELKWNDMSIKLQQDGNITTSNDNGSYTLNANGTVNINGVTIDPSGNVDIPGEATIGGIAFSTHTHQFTNADGILSVTEGPQ